MDKHLTESERKLLQLTSEGFSSKEIAIELGTSEGRVRQIRMSIVNKTYAQNFYHAMYIVGLKKLLLTTLVAMVFTLSGFRNPPRVPPRITRANHHEYMLGA